MATCKVARAFLALAAENEALRTQDWDALKAIRAKLDKTLDKIG